MDIKELSDLKIETTLYLGTKLSMAVSDILKHMSREEVVRMFCENPDVQYIILESHGRY